MTDSYPLTELHARFDDLIARVREGEGPVVLTDGGTPVVAIISAVELEALQQAQDTVDLALCQAIKARSNDRGVPHAEFVSMCESEDAPNSHSESEGSEG